jgi:hypothetical protein
LRLAWREECSLFGKIPEDERNVLVKMRRDRRVSKCLAGDSFLPQGLPLILAQLSDCQGLVRLFLRKKEDEIPPGVPPG